MTDLEKLATDLGLELRTHSGGEKGRHYPSGTISAREVISLRDNLGPVARRCTLAHEIGHYIHGHAPTEDVWLYERQERRADEAAAELLIDEHDYAEAEHLYGDHPGALARELGVTIHVLRVWRGLYERKAA